MYKLANVIWTVGYNLLYTAALVVMVGAIVAILAKGFMFGFSFIWNIL